MGFLFVCLLRVFVSLKRILYSYGDVTIAGEGLQIFTYARHSWPLSSEGSLVCHTFCDIGHPLLWSSPRNCDTQCSCHFLFLRLRSVAAGIRTPNLRLRGVRSRQLRGVIKKFVDCLYVRYINNILNISFILYL